VSWTHERARVATLTRSRPPDDPELITARRNLKTEHYIARVAKIISEAPELSDEQLLRLRAIIRTHLLVG
jgi:hypothetical protein